PFAQLDAAGQILFGRLQGGRGILTVPGLPSGALQPEIAAPLPRPADGLVEPERLVVRPFGAVELPGGILVPPRPVHAAARLHRAPVHPREAVVRIEGERPSDVLLRAGALLDRTPAPFDLVLPSR